ncbi:AAA family ATPase [Pelagibacterium lentulum]|uniref:Endonuclease GajA/Old nuclease/RecF-like AAA domain-containing protein n=1 Tax=Pelagibacterium lentulum TaxID=2029865 RepID=A0A916VWJ4_9HYPH|nr:AAA family ATPase [Pelagibacterium lentulum]GGA45320.1 hypothetical protein GCM10011499_13780 [Pelagibacterium lentulum]
MSDGENFLYDLMPADNAFISRLEIKKLFGRQDINLDFSGPQETQERSINIIYGLNGQGKTTILKFIYFLISKDSGRGHKSWIAALPFIEAKLFMSDGSTLTVSRTKGNTGSYIVIFNKDLESIEFNIIADENNSVKMDNSGTDVSDYLSFVANFPVNIFYMTDDRKYYSNSNVVSRIHRRRPVSGDIIYESGRDYFMRRSSEEADQSVSFSDMAEVITEVFRRQVMKGGVQVQRNMYSIYKQLVESVIEASETPDDIKNYLLERIDETESLTESSIRIGAMPMMDAEVFRGAVRQSEEAELEKLYLVLNPFLDSLQARASGIAAMVDRMEAFVQELNRFYQDKLFDFTIRDGFTVKSIANEQPLRVEWLSSGERQLFIILGSAFLVQDETGIVLIDEPELSLNIIWQREFVGALERISKFSPVQYILASHSPEILTSEAARVVSIGGME